MKRKRGTGSIYLRGNTLWIKYTKNGKPYREPANTSDPRKAQTLLTLRLGQCVTGTGAGLRVERVKIDELAEDFLRDYRINGKKSIDDAETRWRRHLEPCFGGMRAVNITSEHIGRYVDQRQTEGAANATINNELAALKRMFSLGWKSTPKKVVSPPAFPKLAENNTRTGFLEDGQYDRLVEGAQLWFRALVECGSTVGWRHSELITLHVRQVDLQHRVIRLEPGSTKNGEGREAPMTHTMAQLLAACVEGKGPDDRVFTRPNGKPVLDFRTTWQNACARAGVPGLLFHDLRRTAARNLRRAGIPESMVMKIGGWKTTSVFHRYAIVNRQDMADAIQQYEAHKTRKGRIGRTSLEIEKEQSEPEFGHSLGTNDNFEPSENLPKKLQ